tara:strand:+ start:4754 stop:5011 length:258 start_codon:yes stop_codon:yes gene_type:complete
MASFIYPGDTLFQQIRKKHNLTQVAMAEKLKVSQPAYSLLERGKSWPTFEVIEQTMEAFNVPFKRFREYNRERKNIIAKIITRKN